MDTEQLVALWAKAIGSLFIVGWLLAVAAVFLKWRLMRRFEAKTGQEFHPM